MNRETAKKKHKPRKLIVAIDGPAGAGKSTIAKLVASTLGYLYIDTGAMYRAITWKALQEGISPQNRRALTKLTKETKLELFSTEHGTQTLVDGQDVTHKFRSEEVSRLSSLISAVPGVRQILRKRQRHMGKRGGVVMEGRDIGTAVFPDADIKFYLDASPEERARRRYQELIAKGGRVTLSSITNALKRRDERDISRGINPLKKAPDAILIDSTHLDLQGVANVILSYIRNRIKGIHFQNRGRL